MKLQLWIFRGNYDGNPLKIANQAHFPISRKFPCILLSDNYSVCYLLELGAYYDYNSQRVNQPIMLRRNLHLPYPVDLVSKDDDLYGIGGFDKTTLTLIGSCNGFICLLHGETYEVDHSVCISNPLLGEYFKVKLPEREKRICHIYYGFCFSEASGQYKVLRLVTRKFRGHPDVSELEVYTLGVDEKNWRNAGKAPKPVQGKLSDANVNGTIHWLDGENLPKRMDVWWMKEYGIAGSWTRDRISVTLPGIAGRHILIPIIIWKDGEILMQSERGTHLVSYNPKEEMLRKVVNAYGSGTEATRYIPSFYSLKTVMGDNFQVSNAYRKTQIV
ncbi:hypothetical protein H5410_025861 [Solanum commersonii]|uniref:F-box associated beta-propeller type 3 domain-containing protein n=1 Tax=Solanum commersonii TaxID=4109 RepID=A0A9J5YUX8_SOLCO|nr:hypothetical protein H5410_025861 [Solanum commersonii]